MTTPFTQSQQINAIARGHTVPCPADLLHRSEREFSCEYCDGTGTVHPYPNGIGDWLKAKRGSEWPHDAWHLGYRWDSRNAGKLVHVVHGETGSFRAQFAEGHSEVMPDPPPVIHALHPVDALDLLEECVGICYGRTSRSRIWWAELPWMSKPEPACLLPDALLDLVLEKLQQEGK